MTSSPPSRDELLPDWSDPQVQIVYQIMCDPDEPPDPSEHWEGWKARKIVAALRVALQSGSGDHGEEKNRHKEPTDPIEASAIELGTGEKR